MEAPDTMSLTIKAEFRFVVAVVVALRGDGVFPVVYGAAVAGE